jgi:hypothetical protein
LPLDLALCHRRYDLVGLLLAHSVDVNASDSDSDPLLQLAVTNGYVPKLQILVERGASLSSIVRYKKRRTGKAFKLCTEAANEVARMTKYNPSLKMNFQAWRDLWCRWKDDDLLKSSWSRYKEISALTD